MAGLDPISLLVIGSTVASAGGAAFSMFSENEAYKLREKGIRNQQTALRIQETEAAIDNMNNLEQILARQEVMAGVRNIGADSGSLGALTRDTFNEYDRVNDINKLNYLGKKVSLANSSLANSYERRNGQVKSGLGFAESAMGVGFKYKSLLDMRDFANRSRSIAPKGAF